MSIRKEMPRELDYVKIGQRIQKLRIIKGYTQSYISEVTGISESHVSNIETGKTKASLLTLVKISRVIGCTIDELVCDDEISLEYKTLLAISKSNEFELRIINDFIDSVEKNRKYLE